VNRANDRFAEPLGSPAKSGRPAWKTIHRVVGEEMTALRKAGEVLNQLNRLSGDPPKKFAVLFFFLTINEQGQTDNF
jgi:hypothetical protein